MVCVTVSLTSRTRTMGLGERFLPPWTGQGEANKCTVYLPHALLLSPSCGERLQQMGAGQKVLKASF